MYREPRTLERIHMAFRPSKRPSSSASRREQRKASGNAALAAGRYQGIPSYNDEPDPVPVPVPVPSSRVLLEGVG